MENSNKDLIRNVEEAAKLTELMHMFDKKHFPRNEEDFFIIHDKVSVFAKKLFNKYGYDEVKKRQLFHVIANSSMSGHSSAPYFDFDGDDSIEKFINEL